MDSTVWRSWQEGDQSSLDLVKLILLPTQLIHFLRDRLWESMASSDPHHFVYTYQKEHFLNTAYYDILYKNCMQTFPYLINDRPLSNLQKGCEDFYGITLYYFDHRKDRHCHLCMADCKWAVWKSSGERKLKSLFSLIGHVAQEVKEGREERVENWLTGWLDYCREGFAKEYNHKFTISYKFMHLKYCLQNNKIKVM